MKKLLSIFIAILIAVCSLNLFACGGGEDPQGQILLGDELVSVEPFVKWEGRYDITNGDDQNPSKVNLYHTATGFTVDFTGSALYVEFDVSVNGNIQAIVYFDDSPKKKRFSFGKNR
jgi:putative cofactor-binding repeat protein